jgi:hypothetical protein
LCWRGKRLTAALRQQEECVISMPSGTGPSWGRQTAGTGAAGVSDGRTLQPPINAPCSRTCCKRLSSTPARQWLHHARMGESRRAASWSDSVCGGPWRRRVQKGQHQPEEDPARGQPHSSHPILAPRKISQNLTSSRNFPAWASCSQAPENLMPGIYSPLLPTPPSTTGPRGTIALFQAS